MRPDRRVYLSSRVTAGSVMVLSLLKTQPAWSQAECGTGGPGFRRAPSGLQETTGDADSINLEQSGPPHAAADPHGNHAEFGAAPLAFDQDVAAHARTRHAVGMTDGDAAPVDVWPLVGND